MTLILGNACNVVVHSFPQVSVLRARDKVSIAAGDGEGYNDNQCCIEPTCDEARYLAFKKCLVFLCGSSAIPLCKGEVYPFAVKNEANPAQKPLSSKARKAMAEKARKTVAESSGQIRSDTVLTYGGDMHRHTKSEMYRKQ